MKNIEKIIFFILLCIFLIIASSLYIIGVGLIPLLIFFLSGFFLILIYIFLIYGEEIIVANLQVVMHGIARIFLIALLISVIPKILNIIPITDIIDMIGLTGFLACSVVFVISIVTVILLSKDEIVGFLRVIDYYIHRKNVFKNGTTQLGKISEIKKFVLFMGSTARHSIKDLTVYYLIVDIDGKKVKSIFFKDNIYSIGENIDVMVYKNHNYIILKN